LATKQNLFGYQNVDAPQKVVGGKGKKIKRFNVRNSNDLALGRLSNNDPGPYLASCRECGGHKIVRSIYTCHSLYSYILICQRHTINCWMNARTSWKDLH